MHQKLHEHIVYKWRVFFPKKLIAFLFLFPYILCFLYTLRFRIYVGEIKSLEML